MVPSVEPWYKETQGEEQMKDDGDVEKLERFFGDSAQVRFSHVCPPSD